MGSSTLRCGISDPMFEVGTSAEVRALHVMPGAPPPEGELHAHDYRLEVVLGRDELDDRGMVCDLDVLEAALADVTATVRDVDLEVIRPADAEAVTVEVFARWAHDVLAPTMREQGVELLTVRVWESPIAYGGYSAAL
jgi:6-pyruvoyltetrahydropterin/6-carboxytetrahydropterin synthase